ncbi:hypothetical protein [Fluoribacter gormanii]|uniref:Uncharacterized protein n=1 Tax=Fluoribacter gormanii TaxID=464 RepID=A0A377GIU2_9GAMM|nr:hypothetical protein [Fluoribacter gormanii]KTD00359.1 hypothetical protein Lgor_3254 [Fluoribacter gormanii]MCW8443708.1 hypothetical protein [Fluoribacter gormanii]SIQ92529.1 hypothetical protein SAMN05421777_104134 [Fluoribacter gormanii]STO24737.1 Uncharacterised protein [Fluoribacter gormanii]
MHSNKEKTEKKEKANAEYHLASLVKETNQQNGPGHVSISAVKQREGQTKIMHTSFFPGAVGSLVNAVTLGSVPVGGQIAEDPKQDIDEADAVLVKKCSKEEYKNAVKTQKKFHGEVKEGTRAYSVFGPINPISYPIASAYGAFYSSQLSAKKFKSNQGGAPEDMCGIEVYDDSSHVKKDIGVDNCCSSATNICNGAGIPVANPLVPSFFTKELQKHGFQTIDKKEFKSKFGFRD